MMKKGFFCSADLSVIILACFLLLGCKESQKSIQMQLDANHQLLTELSQSINHLSKMQQTWPPDSLAPIGLNVYDVKVTHESKAFRDLLIVQAKLETLRPDFYRVDKFYAILDYNIAIVDKEWSTEGKWSGALENDTVNQLRMEIPLPELGLADEEISIEFNGVGAAPLLPLNISRVN